MKKALKNLFIFFIGVILSAAAVEISLRCYDPFGFRVKGNKLALKKNAVFHFENHFPDDPLGRLDARGTHTKNSLGFRGEKWPDHPERFFKMFTVGGSTTECFFLSDDKTWSSILGRNLKAKFPNIWLNNAGLDGHSTFGHLVLMKDYIAKLSPQMVIFLVGINDVGRDDLNGYDKNALLEDRAWTDPVSAVMKLAEYSALCSTALNLWRVHRAVDLKYEFHLYDLKREGFKTHEIPEKRQFRIVASQAPLLPNYRKRIGDLIETTQSLGAIPVFVTQPALYSCGADERTHVPLGNIQFRSPYNGCVDWRLLEAYNQVLRNTCRERGVFLIDLAKQMPHMDILFSDPIHYNNLGSAKVAEIIGRELIPYLSQELSKFETPLPNSLSVSETVR